MREGSLIGDSDLSGRSGSVAWPNLGRSMPATPDFFLTRPVEAKAAGEGLMSANGVCTVSKPFVGVPIVWSVTARDSVIPRRTRGLTGRGRAKLAAGLLFVDTLAGKAIVLRRVRMIGGVNAVDRDGESCAAEALADKNFEGEGSISELDSLEADLEKGVVLPSDRKGSIAAGSTDCWMPSPIPLPNEDAKSAFSVPSM